MNSLSERDWLFFWEDGWEERLPNTPRQQSPPRKEETECPGDLQAQLHRSLGLSTVLLSVTGIVISELSLGFTTYCPFDLSSAMTLQRGISLGTRILIKLKNKGKQWLGTSTCSQDTLRLKAE